MNDFDTAVNQRGLGLQIEALQLTGAGGRLLLEVPKLTIPAGQSVAIRGPSGAGKTSLIHALCGLAQVNTGRIIWGTTDLVAQTDTAAARFRRNNLGLIFQDFLLFEELSPVENAAIAAGFQPRLARTKIRISAVSWLKRLGIDPTDLRSVDSFSGGERQRIAVARALSHDPAVILADEPTASLDRAAADSLAADLTTLARADGRTLIVVTHDDDLAARLDRVLAMDHGRIVHDSGA